MLASSGATSQFKTVSLKTWKNESDLVITGVRRQDVGNRPVVWRLNSTGNGNPPPIVRVPLRWVASGLKPNDIYRLVILLATDSNRNPPRRGEDFISEHPRHVNPVGVARMEYQCRNVIPINSPTSNVSNNGSVHALNQPRTARGRCNTGYIPAVIENAEGPREQAGSRYPTVEIVGDIIDLLPEP